MDFREADRRYAEIKRQHEVGSLTDEEFDERLRQLMVQDREGRWWVKSRKTGKWHYRDGITWIRRTPPGYRDWELVGWTLGGIGVLFAAFIGVVLVVLIIGVAVLFSLVTTSPPSAPSNPNVNDDPSSDPKPASYTLSEMKAYLETGAFFRDDFSNSSSGWSVVRKSNYGMYYDNGSYHMYNHLPGGGTVPSVHAEGTTGFEQAYVVAVEAKRTGDAPEGAEWGLVCHAQDYDNYYGAGVTTEGLAGIWKLEDGTPTVLASSDVSNAFKGVAERDAFNEGTATNLLTFMCRGPDLVLYVNGKMVTLATDETFSSGLAGLYVLNRGKPLDVLFDNFVVAVP